MQDLKAVKAMIPGQMNAIQLRAPGGLAHLSYERVTTPEPGPGEALVRVHAAAITRGELNWPAARLPSIPSYEFSGVVASLGPGVDGLEVGDPVFAFGPYDRDGAAAEYVKVPADLLAPKPRSMSHVESAAIPLAALSAWQGLFDHGHLEAGQRVLIHGAAGGVGTYAVQLAHRCGAHVIGTTSARHIEIARPAGADQVIDHTAVRFEDAAGPVDLVFDTVGGERQERSPAVLRPGGRLVSVATRPSQALATVHGISAVFFIVAHNRAQLVELARLADKGELRPVIDAVFPLAAARQAFERSLGQHGAGKIVLQVVG
jgi:NADPH:quinone reductase-like Zn-dependent oxidoreductase